ncbi:hypothetical protein [Flagellimonas sp.]|uniref:hypothetical protein n=1 Tax=Flagellimonas sp. TaxID=2058762 RepID=UPI003C7C1241
MNNTSVVLLCVSLLLLSCSYDSESDLTAQQDADDGNELVTYKDHIEVVIKNNCLSCHSDPPVNGAPFPLTTYTAVKKRTESGLLFAAISRQTGETSAMPPGGRMPQATIDLVEQWIEDGLLEN